MRLREGEAALGVWLPLALASMMATVVNAFKGHGAPPVKLSEILAGWALPTMAAAIREDEDKAEAERTIANFNALAKRFGGKVINGEINPSKD